jgi:very-short-patch-repair endonuclease
MAHQSGPIDYSNAVRALSGLHGCQETGEVMAVVDSIFDMVVRSLEANKLQPTTVQSDGLFRVFALFGREADLPHYMQQSASRFVAFSQMRPHERIIASHLKDTIIDSGAYVVHPQYVYGFEMDIVVKMPDGIHVNIELDGTTHEQYCQSIRDRRRDAALRRLVPGLRIIRVPIYDNGQKDFAADARRAADELFALS